MRKNNRTGKGLRLFPLILGGYAVFLGLGLITMGLAEIKEGIGIIRLLIGLGMTGFGLFGIWDGVRDLIRPKKKPEQVPVHQFILTDTAGNRSSNVTAEILQKQLEGLMESDKGGVFTLQVLPPFAIQEIGNISQIFCMYYETFRLTAFLDVSEGGYESYHKSAEFDETKGWFGKLLAGSADFTGWKKMENAPLGEEYDGYDEEDAAAGEEGSIPYIGEEEGTPEDTDETAELVADFDKQGEHFTEKVAAGKSETDTQQVEERIKTYWHQLQREQKGQMRNWHQLLVIFGESWHDEHKFFSARDVELAVEGICEGKYQKAVLEWGTQTVNLFPGIQNDIMVIRCTNNTGKGNTRFLAREGTATQVKFWLIKYMDQGYFEETGGWADITAQIKRQVGKG